MGRLVDLAVGKASGRRVAWAWVAFVAYAAVVFPLFDQVNGMPEAITPLDIQFFHAPSAVQETLTALGGEGRTAYLRSLFIADVLWPVIYGTTLALTIAWGFAGTRRQRALVAAPIATVLLDAAENTLIGIQIVRHPGHVDWLAILSSTVSAVKWLAAGTATVLAVLALGRAWRQRAKN